MYTDHKSSLMSFHKVITPIEPVPWIKEQNTIGILLNTTTPTLASPGHYTIAYF